MGFDLKNKNPERTPMTTHHPLEKEVEEEVEEGRFRMVG